jgi:transcriptional regulator NrdR family protein
MICPYCGKGRALVYDSRPAHGGIVRRRKCENAKCQAKLKTLELELNDNPPVEGILKAVLEDPYIQEALNGNRAWFLPKREERKRGE